MPKLLLITLLALTIFGSCIKREAPVALEAAIKEGERLVAKRRLARLALAAERKSEPAAERKIDLEALKKVRLELKENKSKVAIRETQTAADEVQQKLEVEIANLEEAEGVALAKKLEAEAEDDVARLAEDETFEERCDKAVDDLPKKVACAYLKSYKDERRAPTSNELAPVLVKLGFKCLVGNGTTPELQAAKDEVETLRTIQEIMNAGSSQKMFETAIVAFACM